MREREAVTVRTREREREREVFERAGGGRVSWTQGCENRDEEKVR